MISVTGASSQNNWEITLNFNEHGNMGDITSGIMPASLGYPISRNYYFYKSHYFDFKLVAIDRANKKVRVTFSGRLYNQNNMIDYETVEGSFQATYTEVTPVVPGLEVSAKIDGANWYSSGFYAGGFLGNANTNLQSLNDNKYTIGIVTNHDTSVTGTYAFDADELTNKVILYEFDTVARQQREYINSTGSITLSSKTVGPLYTVIQGTFNLTATHPVSGTAVTVTNGMYKYSYNTFTGQYFNPQWQQ